MQTDPIRGSTDDFDANVWAVALNTEDSEIKYGDYFVAEYVMKVCCGGYNNGQRWRGTTYIHICDAAIRFHTDLESDDVIIVRSGDGGV